MASLSLFQEVFKHQKIEYVVCDSSLRVIEYSAGVIRYAQRISGPLRAQPIERLFDILSGMNADLAQVAERKLPQVSIEKIQYESPSHAEQYFSLRAYPYQQGLLILLVDVTEESQLEQRVTQQRNELDLLSGQLARSRAELDDMLHRFVPSQVADQMISHPHMVKIGGEKRHITALFADMRGFTQLSEIVMPETLLEMLNQHFELIGKVIENYGGIITNFAGDSILAIFNAPNETPEHAFHAVQAGLDIQKSLRNLYDNPRSGMPFVFDFGVAINSGLAVVGYLGYENRMEYTAIGDVINVTARLSGLAKAGQVLLTANTQPLIAEKIALQFIGPVTLRGRHEPVEVYETIDILT
jgi:adenylate cyclase